jgi:hypothetical protein
VSQKCDSKIISPGFVAKYGTLCLDVIREPCTQSLQAGNRFLCPYCGHFIRCRPPCFAAGGCAADPGQVPREVRRPEGVVREGAAGRLLPGEVLGRPQHQHLRREQRFLRSHNNVSEGKQTVSFRMDFNAR